MKQFGDVPPPSWRTQIGNALYGGAKWPPDQVNYFLDQLLDEHAHKLAEKIRTAATPMAPDTCYREAADLIDPEVPGG